jgi:hypothetical protein
MGVVSAIAQFVGLLRVIIVPVIVAKWDRGFENAKAHAPLRLA